MLSVCDYPYYLKRRIASNTGHLSNEVCAQELIELVRTGSTRFVLGHLSQNSNTPENAYQASYCALTAGGMREGIDFTLTVASRSRPVRDGGAVIAVQVIAVGRLKEAWMRDGVRGNTVKRLRLWSRASVVEVDEYRLRENPSPAQIRICVEKEGERILEKIPKGAAGGGDVHRGEDSSPPRSWRTTSRGRPRRARGALHL